MSLTGASQGIREELVKDTSPKRLLFLLPFGPRMDSSHGGGRAMAELLHALTARHTIAVLYLHASDEPPMDEALSERCRYVEKFDYKRDRLTVREHTWRRLRRASMLLSGMPLLVTDARFPAFRRRVRFVARTWNPDIVQAEYHFMGQYLSVARDRAVPSILTEYDPGIDAARESWQSQHGLERLTRFLDLLSWQRYERAVLRKATQIVAFTERDQRVLTRLSGGTPVTCIPLGVRIPEQPLNPVGTSGPSLLFVGNFIHPPNVDAAMRLALSIFPRVRSICPDTRLYLVGASPTPAIRELSGSNIIVTGWVPDVSPYLDRAAVMVAPIRLGGGMRVKVLEALASGKAVVATRRAIEGLTDLPKNAIVIAESDRELADAIIDLLNDAEKRREMATRTRNWATENLSWDHSASAYDELYDSMMRTPLVQVDT